MIGPPMAARVLILTALKMEAAALRRAGLAATVIGIGGGRLGAVPPGTTAVLMVGVGGAIDPALAVGDVVTDAAVAGVRRGAIHTADRVVATAAQKAELFAATGAAVVDLEQAVVRQWAGGLPVFGVRSVSDAAADAVDPAVVRFVTDVGRPRPAVIAAALLRRPGLIRQLRRLDRDTRRALANLGPAVRAVVDALQSATLPPTVAPCESPPSKSTTT